MESSAFSLFKKASNALRGLGLNRIPVLASFYRRIFNSVKPHGVVLATVQGNKMYVNADDLGIAHSLLVNGFTEQYETELFKSSIKPGDVVVDIGSNIGYYALIAAKISGNGTVYAFEPAKNNYELLVKNIEVNRYKNIVPVRKAVSNKNGKTKLFCSIVCSSAPSLSKNNVSENADSVEVETIRLDDFFKSLPKGGKIDVIKMDTQGCEGLVIEGAKEILKKNKLKIFMELWPYGLRNMQTDPRTMLLELQKMGFKMKLIEEEKKCLRDVDMAEIVELCKSSGDLNLLMEN